MFLFPVTFLSSSSASASFALLTENGQPLTTEAGEILTTEVTNNTSPVWTTPAGNIGPAINNVAFSTTVVATDLDGNPNPVSFSLITGTLPSGLSLNSATGEISGTYSGAVSTSIFTLQATDGLDTTDRQFNIDTVLPASITYTDTIVSNISNVSTHTYTNVLFGTPAANRTIVVAMDELGSPPDPATSISSMTIGGIAATLVRAAQVAHPAISDFSMEIWEADVPNGTTGDVVINWNDTVSLPNIGVWALYGVGPAHATSAATTTLSLNVPDNGVALAIGAAGNTAPTYSWVGLTEDYETGNGAGGWARSGASGTFATAQTGLSIISAGSLWSLTVGASWGSG